MKKIEQGRMIYVCSCGEKYSSDGWNLKIRADIHFGNLYHYKRTKQYLIKYTTCSKCGKKVILSKGKFK